MQVAILLAVGELWRHNAAAGPPLPRVVVDTPAVTAAALCVSLDTVPAADPATDIAVATDIIVEAAEVATVLAVIWNSWALRSTAGTAAGAGSAGGRVMVTSVLLLYQLCRPHLMLTSPPCGLCTSSSLDCTS